MSRLLGRYFLGLAICCGAVFALSLTLYRPGFVVEFGDTIFPIQAADVLNSWSQWWSANELGQVWLNPSWSGVLLGPAIAERWLPSGLVQALCNGFWLVLPAAVIGYCLRSLMGREVSLWALGAVTLAALNMRVVSQFGGSLENFTYCGALLLTAAILDAFVQQKLWRALGFVTLAAVVLAPDAANPPYLGIALIHAACVVVCCVLWKYASPKKVAVFVGASVAVALIVSLRWLIPFAATILGSTLTSEGSGTGADYSWVNAAASASNIVRDIPFWYWTNVTYGSLASIFSHNIALKMTMLAPFAAFALSFLWANRARHVTALGAFAIFFWFLSKGQHAPLEWISASISHLPLMWLFRDAEKFLIPANIFAFLAIGVAVSSLSRLERTVVAALCAIGILGAAWPFASGQIFNSARAMPVPYLRVPNDINDFRALSAPIAPCRVDVQPWDTFYEAGYQWGFFGDDSVFFDQLAGAPIVHQSYAGYVSNPPAENFAANYKRALLEDAYAQNELEGLFLIGGTAIRQDLRPGVGSELTPPRLADALRGYRRVFSGQSIAMYRRDCNPAAMTRYYRQALRYLPSDAQTLAALFDLGLADKLLAVASASPIPGAVSAYTPTVNGVQADAQSSLIATVPVESQVILRSANYQLFVRGLPANLEEFKLWHADRSIDKNPAVVLGSEMAVAESAEDGSAARQRYTFLNESAGLVRARLHLPIVVTQGPLCWDVVANGDQIDRIQTGVGTWSLFEMALLRPGTNEVSVLPSTSCKSAREVHLDRSRWGPVGAPDSVTGSAPMAIAPAPFSRAGTDVVAAGSFDPVAISLHASTSGKQRDPIVNMSMSRYDGGFAQVMLRGTIGSGDCQLRVASIAAPTADKLVLDVRSALADVRRASLLPPQCASLPVSAFRLRALDVILYFPKKAIGLSVTIHRVTIQSRRGTVSPSDSISIRIGGHAYTVPADDHVHRIDVGRVAGLTPFSFTGPVRAAALLPASLFAPILNLGGDLHGFSGRVDAGWLLYDQARSRLWHLDEVNAVGDSFLAWGSLQAYPVVAGVAHVSAPILRLQPIAELLSLLGVALFLVVGFGIWRARQW